MNAKKFYDGNEIWSVKLNNAEIKNDKIYYTIDLVITEHGKITSKQIRNGEIEMDNTFMNITKEEIKNRLMKAIRSMTSGVGIFWIMNNTH